MLPVVLCFGLLGAVGILHVASRSQVVDAAYRLSALEAESRTLSLANDRLKLELATLKRPGAARGAGARSARHGPGGRLGGRLGRRAARCRPPCTRPRVGARWRTAARCDEPPPRPPSVARPPAELTRWTRARVLVMGGILMLALGAALLRAVQPPGPRAGAASPHGGGPVGAGDGDPRPARRHLRPARHRRSPRAWRWTRIWLDPSMVPRPASRAARVTSPRRCASTPPSSTRRLAAQALRVGEAPGDAAGGRRGPGAGAARARASPRSRSASTPSASSAAQVLGVVGTDGHGLEGLELAFEDELSGQSEKLQDFARRARAQAPGPGHDGHRRTARAPPSPSPSTGRLQYVAEKALDQRGGREQGHRPAWWWCWTRGPASCWRSPVARASTPTRPAPRIAGRAARPRRAGHLRAGLDLQGLRRRRGAGGAAPSGPRTSSSARTAAGRSAATSSTTRTRTGC